MAAALLAKHPESNFRLVKRSLRLYRATAGVSFLMALCVSILIFIPDLIFNFTGRNIFPIGFFSLDQLGIILIDVVGLMFFVTLLWHMHCRMLKEHEPLREDFSIGFKKAIPVFVATLIQMLIIMIIGSILLALQVFLYREHTLFIHTLPGILFSCLILSLQFVLCLYVSLSFIFFTTLIAVENQRIYAAIKRSVFLVWHNWWRTLAVQLTPWLGLLIVNLLLESLFHMDFLNGLLSPRLQPTLGATLCQIVLIAFFIPWIAATLLVQLHDIELRKKSVPEEGHSATPVNRP